MYGHGLSGDVFTNPHKRDVALCLAALTPDVCLRDMVVKVCKLLFEHGADACVYNNFPMWTAVQRKRWDLTILLIAHGADVCVGQRGVLRAAIDWWC